MSDASPASFCWFDYETFGTSPAWDRPAQFAAIRTDAALEPLGEPEVLWCRQADDYLPHPGACRVTGITPEEANARGLPEHRFIERVRAWLGAPGTCSVGYNSVRFDDEFTRHTAVPEPARPVRPRVEGRRLALGSARRRAPDPGAAPPTASAGRRPRTGVRATASST